MINRRPSTDKSISFGISSSKEFGFGFHVDKNFTKYMHYVLWLGYIGFSITTDTMSDEDEFNITMNKEK